MSLNSWNVSLGKYGQELGCPAAKWRLWVGKTSVNIAR